jgi:hypothetical protein
MPLVLLIYLFFYSPQHHQRDQPGSQQPGSGGDRSEIILDFFISLTSALSREGKGSFWIKVVTGHKLPGPAIIKKDP